MIKKFNKKIIKIIAILVVICLVFSGIFVYLEFFAKEEIIEDEPLEEKEIDDRISPFLAQGLTVEILRIRNRELLDKILKMGTSWRSPPGFYWVVEVDGEIGDSLHVTSAGGVTGEGTFNEWDNILKECRVNYQIEDEQEKSYVTITIMEQQKTGFLGRKTENVEKEKIRLIYDYKTGHWIGDDYLKDKDGYGHHLGEEYEVWFNLYQSDYDHDGIPFWTEVNIYESDPTIDDSNSDPDEDGIPSSWEWRWGYDPNTWDNHRFLDPDVDGIENVEEYMLQRYFSDPFSPDVYIETDGMIKNPNQILDWKHIFYKESQQMIIERFAQHGINVYIDDGWPDGSLNGGGEMLDFVEVIEEVVGGQMYRWYRHNFADERKGVFRYVVVGYNAGVTTASTYNNYDHIIVDSSFEKVFVKRTAYTPRYQKVVLAKAVLHELGHTMGLAPWTFYGIDSMPGGNVRWPETLTGEEYSQYNKVYKSIMNYNYIFPRLLLHFDDRDFFDYSDGSRNSVYDFDDWGHLYLPSFQIDDETYEEPTDETFEDYKKINKHPEPVYKDWIYDEDLTIKHRDEIEQYCLVKNAKCNYRIYVKDEDENSQSDAIDVRVYVEPKLEPVVTRWSLVAEGKLDQKDGKLEFYSYDN
ncbi:MAG: hypothetical protein JSW62_05705, partial [Thermoplasmatales archaeon]